MITYKRILITQILLENMLDNIKMTEANRLHKNIKANIFLLKKIVNDIIIN